MACGGPANGISLHRGRGGRSIAPSARRARPPGVSDHEFVRLKIAALNWMDNNGRGNETNRYTDKGGVATDSARYIPLCSHQ